MSHSAPHWRTRIATTIIAAALCLPLAACSAQNSGMSDVGGTMPMTDASRQAEMSASAEDSAASYSANRSIISNGELVIEVNNVADALSEVKETVADLGGYIETQTVSAYSGERASLTVRVPATSFDEALEQLSEVGNVTNESRSATDVTVQHVDLQARVEALETSVARLTELMGQAATTSELLEAESALTARQAELDGLKAQLEALESEVDEATIWVTLSTSSALPGGPSNFWEGLLAGLASISAAGAGGLVVLGILLPWLALAAVVTVVIVWIVRRRRRAKRGASAAGSADRT